MSIVVGYDRSEASVRALERAAEEVREHHGMLGRLFGSDVAADVKRDADCAVIVVD